ncbi:hypothetical protein D7Y23_07265 [Corallococcus sp. AB050B]|nr:hypothetical protein D7Y23_07265 [Corallococcus sp. AB050B]
MGDEFSEARNRAKSTIQNKWQALARIRTIGWITTIESAEGMYPFIRQQTSKLGDRISHHLPVLIFQSRESPPKEMEVAVPYRSPTGNPYNTRILATIQLDDARVTQLSEFAQAIWFAIDQQMLPSASNSKSLGEALLTWTGKDLLQL